MRYAKIVIAMVMVALLMPLTYAQTSDKSITIPYIDGDISTDPTDGVWNLGTELSMPLFEQQTVEPFGGINRDITIRGVHNGKMVGFLMVWEDETINTESTIERFKDAASIMFPTEMSSDLPSPLMGGPEADKVVNLWFWRGDWQGDLESGASIDEDYPSYGGGHFPQDEGLFLKEVDGGKLLKASPVEDLVANGFGTLTRQESQDVAGDAVHKDGKWMVTFVRSMSTDDKLDVQFKGGSESRLNVAVWDGEIKDRNGMKSAAITWKPVKFEPTPFPIIPVAGGAVIVILIALVAMQTGILKK